MGPLMGTIGGLGTWLSLVFKTAFALIGMGAYLAIFVELPVKPLAIGLTIAFMALNVVGAKESSKLQRWLVTVLLAVLGFFIAQGLYFVAGRPEARRRSARWVHSLSRGSRASWAPSAWCSYPTRA